MFLLEVGFKLAILGSFVVGSKCKRSIVRIVEIISQNLQL